MKIMENIDKTEGSMSITKNPSYRVADWRVTKTTILQSAQFLIKVVHLGGGAPIKFELNGSGLCNEKYEIRSPPSIGRKVKGWTVRDLYPPCQTLPPPIRFGIFHSSFIFTDFSNYFFFELTKTINILRNWVNSNEYILC